MTVRVNGELRELSDGATVAALVAELGMPGRGRGVAVAVDGEVVPRGAWEAHALPAGARVELLTAMQGG